MALRHENLIRFLLDTTSPGETIQYIPNPGNAGDSLIALGTLQLMESLGLRVRLHKHRETFNKNDRVFYGGGGNFVPYYKQCREFILRNTHVQQLVLLPHTVHEQSDVLEKIGPNMVLFARERRSFRHLTQHMRYPENARIDHDLAFAIGPSTIQSLIKNDLGHRSGCLHAFRTDKEATKIEIPPDNSDLSHMCKTINNTQTLEGITESSRAIFEAIAPYAEIKTNRLHIAIASALLNKKTIMGSNSYFKNSGVYRYSIKQNFSNVKFVNVRT
ncbi:polysaccharide pyruvyl transferase family protein [Synechococcus sp. MU1625]|uniref:polysaccharide pyruvyl transferase family protein n=1 Tax=Synechococcus sp. MU1625 TaxID=2508347 RepID=UPI001CF83636|nr:polysaccharide pyruvyl transferase family protein [Synechococcus sp. MU1625]MCB4399485.1 hypothetical protein [Synechococcus sp. MU1625]